MAKSYRFRVNGDVVNATDIAGVEYQYIYRNRILDRGTVNPDGSFPISFRFNKKKLNGRLEFNDQNCCDLANFTNSGISYSLSCNEETNYKAISRKRPQRLDYAFQLDQPIAPIPPTPSRIELSSFQDIYSDTLGGQVINGNFIPNSARFTPGRDIVIAGAGSLGQQDDLVDSTSNDGDQLFATSNESANIQNALTSLNRISGIEDLIVTANGDSSLEADLRKITGLSSVRITGTLANQLLFKNYLLTGARSFDFSGVATGGVNLSASNTGLAGTNDQLNLIGSAAGDILEASIGGAFIRGGSGSDSLTGSSQASTIVAGEGDIDIINLTSNAASDIVSLENITSTLDRDIITNFEGFAQSPSASDRLRFNASVFTNYNANTTVIQADRTQAESASATGAGRNLFIVDTFSDITNTNVSQQGTAWLALASDRGELYYSSNGDFINNRVLISTLNGLSGFVAEQNVQIVA